VGHPPKLTRKRKNAVPQEVDALKKNEGSNVNEIMDRKFEKRLVGFGGVTIRNSLKKRVTGTAGGFGTQKAVPRRSQWRGNQVDDKKMHDRCGMGLLARKGKREGGHGS